MDNILLKSTYSRIISVSRIPLIISLVFLHFDISQTENIDVVWKSYDVSLPMVANVLIFSTGHLFAGVAIGCFFLISGYLFFQNYEATKKGYVTKLRSRCSSLLIPFFLWNIIYLMYALGVCLLRHHVSEEWVIWGKPVPSWIEVIYNGLWERPACGSMWYVRELMLLVLMAPVINKLIQCRYWMWVMFFVGILSLMPQFESYQLTHGGLRGLLLFVAGGAVSVWKVNCLQLFRSWYVMLLFAFIAMIDVILKFTVSVDFYHYYHIMTMFAAALAVFHIGYRVASNNTIPLKTNGTILFFIFASHELFIGPCCKGYSILLDPSSWERQIILWLLTIISVLILCFATDGLTRRYYPGLYKQLTGRR